MPLHVLARWLRWSNTRQAWQERLGTMGTISLGAMLWFLAGGAPMWLQVLGWASLALVLAYFSRRGWIRLFGPVLFYDLVRNGRRSRLFMIRVGYLSLLLLGLCWMYLNWTPHSRIGEPIHSNEAAEFALRFFITFMAVQLLLITILTPAVTAGTITEEKERQTLEFILATDLRNREIVFGKLVSRIAYMCLFILAGLPVLSALQFLGGFPPLGLLIGFAATGVTIVSLASLSICASVLCRRTREALLFVYLLMLGYFAISFLGYWPLSNPQWTSFPSTETWTSPLTLEDVIFAIQSGNPIIVMQWLNPRRGLDLDAMPGALGKYSLFHGVIAAGSLLIAVGLLRRASLKEPAVSRTTALRNALRPGPGNWPMIWKEIWLERLVRRRWLIGGFLFVLMGLSFIPAGIMLYEYWCLPDPTFSTWNYYSNPWERLGREINAWVRGAGMIVAMLGLIGVGVRAATSIRGEHERDTMTSLLTSPLSSEEILFSKWLGSLLSIRWIAVWLGLIWLVGIACNGLTPFAVPLLTFAYLCYAAAVASLGLWFSLLCRTSLRAIFGTLLAMLLLGVGHWLPWMCCMPFMSSGDPVEYVAMVQGALTPPAVLAGYLPITPEDFETRNWARTWNPPVLMFLSMCGALCWAGFAWFIWHITNIGFKNRGGRIDGVMKSPYLLSVVDDAPIRDNRRGRAFRICPTR